ncbi:MAG: DUF2808 domain-containing protein [Cyanothece sp. SIO2G6]|nr:DUF2808 domain-containing protein [Cyanothece sp. SIO2G6]
MGPRQRSPRWQRVALWSVATVVTLASLYPRPMGINIAAQAVRLSDGKIYFEAMPRLTDATITRQSVSDRNAKYYFELSLPADAGESLQRLEITQQNGDLFTREVEFERERSLAFVGQRRSRGEELTISATLFDQDTHTTTVIFDPPITPGTDFTLRLRAERNPRQAGVYLFGVTAYPSGNGVQGQFLGFGRFHIYENDSNLFR